MVEGILKAELLEPSLELADKLTVLCYSAHDPGERMPRFCAGT